MQKSANFDGGVEFEGVYADFLILPCFHLNKKIPILTFLHKNMLEHNTEMSRAGGRLATKSTKPTKTTKPTANGVSVNNDDCLDGLLDSAYDVSTTVQSAASNPSLSCSKLSPQNSVECLDRQPSLQELIEAELTARFAPLQPDSLEGLITQEYHEHTRTIINGNDVTSSCTALLDSLEEQPFSLDSLADAESGVDLTSPHNPNSGRSFSYTAQSYT
ncbi:hypothetical protein Avbf_04529 [Armadillidium vulgare]|nr:hypothetical protein Avbf_04529 [Armadillidium vulgare]